MYIVRDYLTLEVVAITTSHEDALALVRSELDDRKLIIEETEE